MNWHDTAQKHREAFDTYYLWNPIVKRIWLDGPLDDLIAAMAALNDDGTRGYMDSVYHRNILEGLKVEPGLRVLNVGCGYGLHELELHRRCTALELVGCDISGTMLRTARWNRTPAWLAQSAAESLPFADNAFHRVLCREVIEHVIDPPAVLRELYRVCAPGGVAVVTTPNGSGLVQWAANLTGWFTNRNVQDRAYRLRDLRQWITGAGFTIERRILDGAAYFMLVAWPRWLRWLAPAVARGGRLAERLPIIRTLVCDQVKYVLRKPGELRADLAAHATARPEPPEETDTDRRLREAVAAARMPARSRASRWVRGFIAAVLVPPSYLVLSLVLLPISLIVLLVERLRGKR